ncbi:L-type lectin-domain containing receptor kinase VIII.1-like [Nymphaea colorata]|uniref:L-type lectin-domain containing receptor kinase VIII.1-like n=1 Tax=Nymphaea colorata TaxID=210225 RepID=UPI00129D9749|nr:L-type lectin-domain containing receptor kinase VIII.1-like [Nymphaea colorata]
MAALSFFFFALAFLPLLHISSSKPDPGFSYQPSFSFAKFEESGNNLGISLLGDARFSRVDAAIRITNGSFPSSGRVLHMSPIEMFRGKSRLPISFLSSFSFSISPGNGGLLAFAFWPTGTSFDLADGSDGGGTSKGFVVRLDASSETISVRMSDVPRVGFVSNEGERLHCWIKYNSGSRVIEVGVGNSSEYRRFSPVISYSADLLTLWDDKMLVGIGASSTNSSQITTLYSWSFRKRYSAFTLHSDPLDPRNFAKVGEEVAKQPRKSNAAGVFAAFVLGAGCAAMAAAALLLMRSFLAKKSSIGPSKFAVAPANLGYEKINIVRDNIVYDAKE